MTDDSRTGDRGPFHDDPLEHARVWAGMSVGDLAAEYGKAGIGAADLAAATDITTEIFGRDDVTTFMGLAGAMVPGGMRRIVADLVRDGYVDVLVTTGANLTHDAIEAIGGHHHHGEAPAPDDRRDHDEALRAAGVDRIYNVHLPQEHFAAFEDHLRREVFPELDGPVPITALTRELGRANAAVNADQGIAADPGIAAAASERDVPVYCPAVQDSVLGLQAWIYSQTTDFTLDALADMTALSDRAHEASHAGAFLVGGGVPKNFVLQTMLTAPRAYDYAVQLTTDPEHTGGLTGATLDEARSWGKLEPEAQNATVVGDATVTLPLVVAAVRDRLDR